MSLVREDVVPQLAGVVGAPNVVIDPREIAGYEIDGKRPMAVVRPGSSREAAEVVKFAASEKLALVATGTRTKLRIGLVPSRYNLALDMTRLDKVVAYDPGDLTISVESGVPLSKLAGVLTENRQFLPLAMPYANQATLGGTISSGVDTPLRQLYGMPRDYVLGMEFITGEGVLAKSGGRVVKNVTGYDLHKLMIGALGTLGIITQIHFRTFPLPATSRAFVAVFDTADLALELRQRVSQSPHTLTTLEILSPRAAELFSSDVAAQTERNPFPKDLLSKGHWAFTAGFAGNERVLERCERDLRQMAKQSGAIHMIVFGEDQIPGAFGRKREFVPIALESSPATTIIKMGLLPTRMKEILTTASEIADRNALPWATLARGVGVVYLVLLPGEYSEEMRRRVVLATEQICAECAGLGGNATIPWCPSEWKGTLKVWGIDRGDSAPMRKVKSVFDPHGILAPGRLMGGL